MLNGSQQRNQTYCKTRYGMKIFKANAENLAGFLTLKHE